MARLEKGWPGVSLVAADDVEVVEAGEDARETGGRCNGEAHWRLLGIGGSMIFL